MSEENLKQLPTNELIQLMLENVDDILEISKESKDIKAIQQKADFIELIHTTITSRVLDKHSLS